LFPAPAAQTTSKADKEKIVKISEGKRIKTTGANLRQGMGSKSDQLLQLTGFAVHLRSRLQIGADEIDPSKARSPSRTGGTVDPRAEGSALPAVPDGGLGEVHGGEPAREEVEVAC